MIAAGITAVVSGQTLIEWKETREQYLQARTQIFDGKERGKEIDCLKSQGS